MDCESPILESPFQAKTKSTAAQDMKRVGLSQPFKPCNWFDLLETDWKFLLNGDGGTSVDLPLQAACKGQFIRWLRCGPTIF
jgi:hypothetical protein